MQRAPSVLDQIYDKMPVDWRNSTNIMTGVADVVHAVQQLADRAVGKRQLKIEHAVAQCNDGARREINDAEHENGLLRSVRKISTQLAAMDSRIEMHDVSVAKIAVMKKRAPTNVPALPRFTSFLT